MTAPADPYRPFPPFADWARLPLDRDMLDRHFAVIDELRMAADPEILARAVQTATRAAAIDTGAIEGLYDVDRGFTMTVAVRTAAWEAVVASREPVVRRSFEDALRAYDYVLDLATTRTEISEKAIREIHAQICASQDVYKVVTSAGVQERALPKGEYKEAPNNPTSRVTGRVHAYAPPIDVSAEMHRLVSELRSEAFAAAHPVLQAAYAHYAFVAIHPFADGNGRVARALASVFLYRRPGVPLVIFADQKDEYLDGLEAADAGRPERFVRFVQERVVDVIGLVQVSMATPGRTQTASLASLRDTFVSREGLSLDELDRLAATIRDAAVDAVRERLTALTLPGGVEVFDVEDYEVGPRIPAGYRFVRESGYYPRLLGIRGADVSTHASVRVGVRKTGADGSAFLLLTQLDDALSIELREVFPTFSAVLHLKLGIWADNVVTRLVAVFDDESRRELRAPE